MSVCGLALDTMFVNDQSKKNNYNNKTYRNRGLYSVLIEQQLVPILVGRPYVKLEKTKRNQYTRWVAPVACAYQIKTPEGMEWFFPIFKSVKEFQQSTVGKAFLSANKWWKSDAWVKTFEESGCDYFTPIVPVSVRGPQVSEGVNEYGEAMRASAKDLSNEPYTNQRGYTSDDDDNAIPAVTNEAGKLWESPYPNFILPVPVNKVSSQFSRGGRYHNIHPITYRNETKWLEAYANTMGRKLEKPHRTKKATSLKALTKKEKPLFPKQLFMEQYSLRGDLVLNVKQNLFYVHKGSLVETIVQMELIPPAALSLFSTPIGVELVGSIMRGYISNNHNENVNRLKKGNPYNLTYQDGSDMKTINIRWPLETKDITDEPKIVAWLGESDLEALKVVQPSISLPRVFTYYTFDGGQEKGTPHKQVYWPHPREGIINFAYANFLTQNIWDMEKV